MDMDVSFEVSRKAVGIIKKIVVIHLLEVFSHGACFPYFINNIGQTNGCVPFRLFFRKKQATSYLNTSSAEQFC